MFFLTIFRVFLIVFFIGFIIFIFEDFLEHVSNIYMKKEHAMVQHRTFSNFSTILKKIEQYNLNKNFLRKWVWRGLAFFIVEAFIFTIIIVYDMYTSGTQMNVLLYNIFVAGIYQDITFWLYFLKLYFKNPILFKSRFLTSMVVYFHQVLITQLPIFAFSIALIVFSFMVSEEIKLNARNEKEHFFALFFFFAGILPLYLALIMLTLEPINFTAFAWWGWYLEDFGWESWS